MRRGAVFAYGVQMLSLPRALSLLTGAALVFVAMPVFAQMTPVVSIDNPTSLARTDANGNGVEKRPLLATEGINFDDCLADQRLVLPITVSNATAGAHLEVWAAPSGVDCTAGLVRSGATVVCTSLVSAIPVSGGSVNVPVRAIVAAALFGSTPDISICGTVDRTTVGLQVLLFDSAHGTDALSSASLPIEIDTLGNPAPAAIVDQVQGTVHVTATPPDNVVTTGFGIYCAPAYGNDAGTCSGSAISYMGAAPDADFDARYRCVTIVANGTMPPYDAYVKGSPDGTQFAAGTNIAVRVSSLDDFGNLGALSAPQCAVVEQVADVGDPTGCSAVPGRYGPANVVGILAAAGVLLMARRRRR